MLEKLALDCQAPPPTPVVGNVVVRHGMMSMETFFDKLTTTHPHRRAVTVEISVPRALLRCPHDHCSQPRPSGGGRKRAEWGAARRGGRPVRAGGTAHVPAGALEGMQQWFER